MSGTNTTETLNQFKSVLTQLLGQDSVRDDLATRELYSQDIWTKGELAEIVVSPSSLEELSSAAAAANERNIPLNPRGWNVLY